MTEKRFEYIRTKYRHYIQDVEKDGKWKKGYKGTYGDLDLDKITDLLNQLNDEVEKLKSENQNLMKALGESSRMAVETLLPKDEDTLTLNEKWW